MSNLPAPEVRPFPIEDGWLGASDRRENPAKARAVANPMPEPKVATQDSGETASANRFRGSGR